jgi:hypothetical protein
LIAQEDSANAAAVPEAVKGLNRPPAHHLSRQQNAHLRLEQLLTYSIYAADEMYIPLVAHDASRRAFQVAATEPPDHVVGLAADDGVGQ